MKKPVILLSLLPLLFTFCFSVPGAAQEKANREECRAKCKEAAKLIQEAGLEAAIAGMNDKNGPFVWKDSYVACINMETGRLLAHPYAPSSIGSEVKYLSDPKGKLYIEEMIKLAESKGEGWVSYLYPKPGDQTHSLPKTSFVLKIPSEKVMLIAGYFD